MPRQLESGQEHRPSAPVGNSGVLRLLDTLLCYHAKREWEGQEPRLSLLERAEAEDSRTWS